MVVSLVLLPGCVAEPGATEYREITKNSGEGNSLIVERFDSYAIDKQIDVFLYSEDPRFEAILARNGKSKIQPVVSRIEEKKTTYYQKWRLVRVLHRIQNECRCVKSDRYVMSRLERLSDLTNENAEHYKSMFSKDVKYLREM